MLWALAERRPAGGDPPGAPRGGRRGRPLLRDHAVFARRGGKDRRLVDVGGDRRRGVRSPDQPGRRSAAAHPRRDREHDRVDDRPRAGGGRSPGAACTSTPRRPATSTRRTCGTCSPPVSASSSGRSSTAGPRSSASRQRSIAAVLQAAARDRGDARRGRRHRRRAPRRSRRSQTRKAKDYGVDADDLEQRWRDEAAAVGFGPREVGRVLRPRTRRRCSSRRSVERCFDALAGPHGLTERSATFRRTDVIEAIAIRGRRVRYRRAQIEALADRFLASIGAARRPQPHRLTAPSRLTSSSTAILDRGLQRVDGSPLGDPEALHHPRLVAIEARLLAVAESDRARAAVVDGRPVDASRGRSAPSCRTSSVRWCGPCARRVSSIQPVAGRPGRRQDLRDSKRSSPPTSTAGVPIIGCAVSATAAAELEHAAGFARSTGAPATTVARLLLDLDEPTVAGSGRDGGGGRRGVDARHPRPRPPRRPRPRVPVGR